MKSFLLTVAVGLLASCKTLVPPPEIDLEGRDPEGAWVRVLAEHVDERGVIDFEGLRADPGQLDLYVAWIARSGGAELMDEARTAHLVNAYNALAMYNVLHAGVLPKSKVRFFYLRELMLDGSAISLYDLENEVIRPLGEARVHFALNCMVRSCPRLPQAPFTAPDLDAQLEAAATEFLNDPRHVRLLPDERRVRLSAILDWYGEDFLAVAPSLLAYVNRYRSEPVPEDWAIDFLPYDWTLKQATGR